MTTNRSLRHAISSLSCALACNGGPGGSGDAPDPDDGLDVDEVTVPCDRIHVGAGSGAAVVDCDPFGMSVELADGTRWTAPGSADPALGVIAFAVADRLNPNRYYDPLDPRPSAWIRPGRVISAALERDAGGVVTRAALRVEAPPQVGSALALDLRWGCRAPPEGPPVCGVDVGMTVEDPGAVMFSRLSWSLDGGEALYGLGERFDHPDLAGRKHAMQMEIGGTDSGLNEVHVPVPWIVSTRGYAVLVEETSPGAFDVGATDAAAATATYASPAFSFAVVTARDSWVLAGEVAHRTGMPRLPPMWSFGPQMWRNELEDRAELLDDARAIREHDLPVSVLWIDNPWQTSYNDFTFNPLQFPDAPSMIRELHDRGFRVLAWSTPYLNTSDDSHVRAGMNPNTGGLYEEALERGYLVRLAYGGVAEMPWTSGKLGGKIDFTNPAASEWWTELVRRATRLGIDGFKLDYGELTPHLFGSRLNLRFHDGRTESELHAAYSVLYHQAYQEALRRDRPEGFIIGRASTLGGQPHVDCIWPGDLDRDFSDHREPNAQGNPSVGGLPAAVHALQSLSVSGFPTFGSDTGGYRGGAPTSEVLVRWAAHTAFTPVMQIGGGGDSHNPWDTSLYPGDWVLPAMRKFMKTHQQLVPYLFSLVRRASAEGAPPVLPVGLAYPGDPDLREDGCAYMLGERMLVAPACRGEDPRRVRLPAGTWVDWWTGEVRSGPAVVDIPNPIDSIPVFLAPGAVVPLFPAEVDTMVPSIDPAVVYAWESGGALVFRVVPAQEGRPGEGRVFGPDGAATDAYLSVALDGDCQRFDRVPPVVSTRFRATVIEIDWRVFSGSPPSSVGGFAPAASVDDVFAGCGGCWFHDAAAGKVYATPIPSAACR